MEVNQKASRWYERRLRYCLWSIAAWSQCHRRMSELLWEAFTEARQGNSSIKQEVTDIGIKFVNNFEISAQVAVYIVLQLPLRKASRQIIFINTSPPEERVELLKPFDDIKEMDDDCEEIYAGGLLKW